MATERYVAIDNVCAWPNLTHMPDGAAVATIFNQPTHGGWVGDVDCWASEDEGRTWTLRGCPAPHDPETNRMNVAAGLARDGALVVLACGWSRRPPVGEYAAPMDGEVLPTWVCRSNDGGRTWERGETVEAPQSGDVPLVPFGDIVHLDDGTLGVCLYTAIVPDAPASHFYCSTDDGRTWQMRGTIRANDANETAPLALGNGRLLAALRTTGDGHLNLYASDDSGATWQCRGPLTLGAQHPAHLLLLKDGRVLLTYGIRNKGLYGVGYRISSDNGESWGHPAVLVNLTGAEDGGYPSSVQAADGTIVTAYYCDGVTAHQRYHMGVVRWTADE